MDEGWAWKPYYRSGNVALAVNDTLHSDMKFFQKVNEAIEEGIEDAMWVMFHGPRLGPPSPPRFGPPLPDYHDDCDQCEGHPGYQRTVSDLPAWPRVEVGR